MKTGESINLVPERLNAAQQEAVEHNEGPALVVAGAGTGKTRVITRRIARLINEEMAQPHQILALTFTEKAAREMAERLYEIIGWRSYQVPVLTFNAFGSELLGRYASHIGRSTRGGLINDTQKALLLQQYLDRVELSYYGPHTNIFEFLEGVVEYIGRLQNAGISAEKYQKLVTKLQQNPQNLHPQDVIEQVDLSHLYSLYEAIKTETGTYDYNDQLRLPLQILQQRPNLAERLQKQYRYVLVDEYQDTNTLQDELLRAFIPPQGHRFAVGDDDQASYGF
jgi:DNA helicase-2/ATP-dependent DNA helicase PcrA